MSGTGTTWTRRTIEAGVGGHTVNVIIESDGVNEPTISVMVMAEDGGWEPVSFTLLEESDDDEIHDQDKCCECGSPDHTCQDCPIFQGGET